MAFTKITQLFDFTYSSLTSIIQVNTLKWKCYKNICYAIPVETCHHNQSYWDRLQLESSPSADTDHHNMQHCLPEEQVLPLVYWCERWYQTQVASNEDLILYPKSLYNQMTVVHRVLGMIWSSWTDKNIIQKLQMFPNYFLMQKWAAGI